MIVPAGHALHEASRWYKCLGERGRAVQARAEACGWRVVMMPARSGHPDPRRPACLYAEPLALDGDAFDPASLNYTLPVRMVTLRTRRYAETWTLQAHPLDARELCGLATVEAPVLVEWPRVPDIGGLRRFWRENRTTSPKRQPIGGLRRFWRRHAPVRVTLTVLSPGVALDHEERTVYTDGPGPWWFALEVEGVNLTRPLAAEWAALRRRVDRPADLARLDWLWDRMTPTQRDEAGRPRV